MRHQLSLILMLSSVCTFAQTEADSISNYSLEEVVVTGSNQATSRNLLPYTVSVVNNKQIEATGQGQLLSALSGRVPGLFVSERNVFGFGVSNGGSGGIKIRGVGGSPTNAVLMMVDGQPQFAGIYSHHVADFYETEYVDHVEVLRGPGSVLYGSNAMGGVINVITKNAKQDGVHTTLKSQFGSYNTWRSSLTNTTRYGKFSSLVSLAYDRTDGTQDNFDFKQMSGYAKIGYDFSDNWNVRADYSIMDFEGNDPIYATLSNPDATAIYHQDVIRGEASLTANNQYEHTNGSLRVYYSYGNHFIDDPRHFHSLDDRFGVLAYQNFKPWKNADATVGFDFDRYTGKIPMSGGNAHTEGSLSTMSRQFITEYSPYVTITQGLFGDILTLNAGLRVANSNRFDTQLIPQGGFVVHPGKNLMIKGSVAKGYRNPSFREMYLYRTANPDLNTESMVNYELTVGKHFSQYFGLNLTGYFCEGSNLIQTVNSKNENTGSFINKGIEVSATSQPLDNLSIQASYSYMHTSLSNLTAAPKNQYFVGVAWRAIPKLLFDVQMRGVGGLYVADDYEHQSYVLLDFKATYSVLRWLDLFVTLDNITDTDYTINRGYQMPGFTAFGGFKIQL